MNDRKMEGGTETRAGRDRLADALETLLSEEIRLSGDVIAFLDSVLGIDTAEAFRERISGPADHEAETLMELLFFPDMAQQVRLEPILETANYRPADIAAVLDRLTREPMMVALRYPGHEDDCRIGISRQRLHRFVHLLNIDRIIDQDVSEAIRSRCGDRERALRLRVMLRNSRFDFSEEAVGFLRALLENMDPMAADYPDLFAFACDLIEETGPAADIEQGLIDRRRRLAEAIRQTRNSEKRRSGLPVEALLMRGEPVVAAGVDAARRRIGLIDRIRLAVYGRTALPGDPEGAETPRDLGLFGKDPGGVAQVIKILS